MGAQSACNETPWLICRQRWIDSPSRNQRATPRETDIGSSCSIPSLPSQALRGPQGLSLHDIGTFDTLLSLPAAF